MLFVTLSLPPSLPPLLGTAAPFGMPRETVLSDISHLPSCVTHALLTDLTKDTAVYRAPRPLHIYLHCSRVHGLSVRYSAAAAGPLPAEIGNLTGLQVLDLSTNFLSGENRDAELQHRTYFPDSVVHKVLP